MKDWIMVLKAADAAARWHVHQRRKGAANEPYINHLLEVASLVAEATEGNDPSLHDAIEDCEVPYKLIAEPMSPTLSPRSRTIKRSKRLSARSAKSRSRTRRPIGQRCSSSPTRPAICGRLFPVRRKIGQFGAGLNTSIGLAASPPACAA